MLGLRTAQVILGRFSDSLRCFHCFLQVRHHAGMSSFVVQGALDPVEAILQLSLEVVVPRGPGMEIEGGQRQLVHSGTLDALHIRTHRELVEEG
eukprot:3375398-Pyramimonas_sp.AAC.1